jgi:hypothetical protein
MHRLRAHLTLAACALLAVGAGARGDEAPPAVTLSAPSVATVSSEDYPEVTCTGTKPQMIEDVVQLAADTRDSLANLLQLGPKWRYPVHITLLDPVAGQKPPREAVAAFIDGNTLKIEAALSSNDLDARQFIQRQFVTALLWEKFFKPNTVFTTQTRLDAVPLWLVEGLREHINDDPDHDRDEIVKRAALANRAPTLAEVTGWKDLNPDRLGGIWQRAFCYYLVESLTHQQARRDDFQQWLASITGPNPSSALRLFPTEMGWQRELREASDRSRGFVFTWDESAAELTAAETIALPKDKHGDDTRLCTIETVGTFPRSKAIDAAIGQKVLELTALQFRMHPSWQPIVELYRFGLTALVRDNDPKRAADYIHEAHVLRAEEMDSHTKLVDYMNWYEVTQNLPSSPTRFRAYFQVAQELDRAQDPQHPNPIRTDLLKVESEF